jgi:poly-gamma-glutamate synthesis protein (capsule biosynthesis protein)
MYLITVEPRPVRLVEARIVPMQARQLRLQHAPAADPIWLHDLLNRLGAPFGTYVQVNGDTGLELHWR